MCIILEPPIRKLFEAIGEFYVSVRSAMVKVSEAKGPSEHAS